MKLVGESGPSYMRRGEKGNGGRGGGKEIQGILQGKWEDGKNRLRGEGEREGEGVKGGKIMLLSLPAVRWYCIWEILHHSF